MAETDDFNQRDVLRRHLDQAIRNQKLEGIVPRIIIGRLGGIAYKLFSDRSDLPLNGLTSINLDDLGNIERYIESVTEYIEVASGQADQFEWTGLVNYQEMRAGKKVGFLDNFDKRILVPLLYLGIGAPTIDSFSTFTEFLKMVDIAHRNLRKPYERIIVNATNLRRNK